MRKLSSHGRRKLLKSSMFLFTILLLSPRGTNINLPSVAFSNLLEVSPMVLDMFFAKYQMLSILPKRPLGERYDPPFESIFPSSKAALSQLQLTRENTRPVNIIYLQFCPWK